MSYFEGVGFRSDFRFGKLWAKIGKFWYFGPKSIDFLILTKFCKYPISKVLILNLTLVFKNTELPSPNLGILDQKNQLSNLTEIILHLQLCDSSDSFQLYVRTKIPKCGINWTKPITASWGKFVKVLISSTKFF